MDPLETISKILGAKGKLNVIEEMLEPLTATIKAGTATDGEKERAANLTKAAEKLRAEIADGSRQLRGVDLSRFPGIEADGIALDDQILGSPGARLHPWTSSVLANLNGQTMRQRGTHSVSVPVGGIFNVWPSDPLRENSPDEEPHRLPRRVRFVHEIMPSRTVDQDEVSYIRQTTRTNNATAVARHGVKPTSIYNLDRIQDRCRTIAHVSEPIAVQDLDDNANLDQFVVDELVHGLRLGLGAQVPAPLGTGENMAGLLEVVTATEAFDTDLVDTARNAITTLEEAEVVPQAFLMTPVDWAGVEKMKATTGVYIVDGQDPIDRRNRRLWSVPVVTTNALAAGQVLLGDFTGARIAYRDSGRVDWATAGAVFDDPEYHDLFDANEVKARAELRAVLEILVPSKFLIVETA